MDRKLEQVFEECLERILASGESLEQCLRTYPEQAEQLEPLLRAVLQARGALAQPARPEFRARLKARFVLAPRRARPRGLRLTWGWQHRLATAGMAVLVAITFSGTAIVAAERIPADNPLYEAKLATEKVRLVLAGSDAQKVKLNANFVDRRVAELSSIAPEGDPEKVERVVRNLDRNLDGIRLVAQVGGASMSEFYPPYPPYSAEYEPEKDELRPFLRGYARKHNKELRQLFVESPASVQTPMLDALRLVWTSYRSALESVGENPDIVSH